MMQPSAATLNIGPSSCSEAHVSGSVAHWHRPIIGSSPRPKTHHQCFTRHLPRSCWLCLFLSHGTVHTWRLAAHCHRTLVCPSSCWWAPFRHFWAWSLWPGWRESPVSACQCESCFVARPCLPSQWNRAHACTSIGRGRCCPLALGRDVVLMATRAFNSVLGHWESVPTGWWGKYSVVPFVHHEESWDFVWKSICGLI